jgi:phosphatidylserine/phosphatidylglycerophosphate/cardiolipin synthase-like enzyme
MKKSKLLLEIVLSIVIIIALFLFYPKEKYESPSISVYYNNPNIFDKPQTKTDSEAGKVLVDLINEANKRIDFAVYGVRNQEDILNALLNAKNRGVIIRGIVDKDIENESYYSDTEKFITKIGNIKTDYLTDKRSKEKQKKFVENPYWPKPEGFNGPAQCVGYSLSKDKAIISVQASKDEIEFKGDIMHNKFFVIDNKKVWTGSTNISDSCSGGYNANVAAVVDNKEIASWFTNEFQQMYEKELFHKEKKQSNNGNGLSIKTDDYTEVSGFFSPQDDAMRNGVIKLIKEAKKSINISVFYLTHKDVAGELIKAKNRGVKIQIILDATSAGNGYTKHEILRAAGIPVKVENWGGKMHMKAASIDDSYIIVGSMNWTSAGERANDENTLIIKNKKLAKEYNEFFKEIWNNIPDKYLKNNPAPESSESTNSLTDGIDNDHDNIEDNEGKVAEIPPYRIVPKQDGYQLIKGVVNKNGYPIYVLPNNKYYTGYIVNKSNEGYFPSIEEAEEAGFKEFENYMVKDKKDSEDTYIGDSVE